jgi:glucokinase
MSQNILGIDVGGTKIYGARYNAETFQEELVLRVPTKSAEGFSVVYPHLIDILNNLKTDETIAIGIGVPGPVTPEGVIIRMPNIPDSDNLTLQADLERDLRTSITVANDAVCFLVGEHHFGAGKGLSNILGLTLGTGVGGAAIINNQPITGKDGVATEFGHIIINKDQQYQTLEDLCSGQAINRRLQELLSSWSSETQLTTESKGKDIYTAAINHDPLAIELYSQVGHDLGIGISNLILCFNPEAIIIGGSVKTALPFMEESMLSVIKENVFDGAEKVKIGIRQAEKPGSHGAAWLARERVNKPHPEQTKIAV